MKDTETIPKEISPFLKIPKEEIVGRSSELEKLRNILASDQQSVVLKGKNGIGKTTLAAVYATEFYKEYDHIVWLTIGDSLEDEILSNFPLLTNLGILKKNADFRIEECCKILNSLSGDKPNLLVLDDANVSLSVHYEKLPSAPNWHLLITSEERLSRFQVVELDPLPEDAAIQLFNKRYKEFTIDQVQKIVCALEFHPLLIEILAKSSCANRLTYDSIKQGIVENTNGLISSSLFNQNQADKIKTFLSEILDLNHPGENETWLLKQFLALPGIWLDTESLKELLQADKLNLPLSFPDLLADLSKRGFLLNDHESGTYKMHSLVREALMNKFNINPIDVIQLIQKVSLILNNIEKMKISLGEFPFIRFGEAILKVFPSSKSHEISLLQNDLANVYKDLGEFEKARELLETALQTDLENFGEKHPEIAVRQSNLAHIYRDLGEYEEARDLFESALQSDLENFGEKHPKVASHHSNLAHVYKDLGEFEKARDLLENTLKIDLEIYDTDHPFISQTQANLATVYKNMGEFEKARDLLESALQSDLTNFGENHPSISVSRSNLAVIYRDLGENEKARDLLEKAITSDLVNLGEKHPNIAVRQSILANVYAGLGEHVKAKGLWEKALRSNIENFGENHPNVALCQSNLASVYSNLGEFPQARDLLEEALKSDLVNFGEKHPYVALSQSNLANVYYNLGEYETARDLFEKTLLLHQEIYEPDHPFISQAQSNLANVMADLGEYEGACCLLEKALETDLVKLGDTHPNIAVHKSNLANLHADFGEIEKARDLWISAYQILVNALGADHPNTKAVKGYLDEFRIDQLD
jgi:tetratricopeptide (TPR) repeat protein